jgi:hypothetical protein
MKAQRRCPIRRKSTQRSAAFTTIRHSATNGTHGKNEQRACTTSPIIRPTLPWARRAQKAAIAVAA